MVDFDLDVAIRTIVAGRAALDASRTLVVAIDGRSGTGKSTLARRLAEALPAAVIDGDDFFAGGVEVRADSAAERAAACIDWRRQRPALLALRAGQPASWRPFDWEAFDGRLAEEAGEAGRPVPREAGAGHPGPAGGRWEADAGPCHRALPSGAASGRPCQRS